MKKDTNLITGILFLLLAAIEFLSIPKSDIPFADASIVIATLPYILIGLGLIAYSQLFIILGVGSRLLLYIFAFLVSDLVDLGMPKIIIVIDGITILVLLIALLTNGEDRKVFSVLAIVGDYTSLAVGAYALSYITPTEQNAYVVVGASVLYNVALVFNMYAYNGRKHYQLEHHDENT